MPTSDDFDQSDPFSDADARDIERQMNIHRLKNEASELAGGQMTTFESPDLPPEVSEQFWENVVAFERAPLRTIHQKLKAADIPMPPAAEMSDEGLHARLWQIIEFLATQKTFLSDTNHLSERELYTHLRDESFCEASPDFPGMNLHLSPIGSGNEESTWLNFRFYAGDDSRTSWMNQFPDYEMPERIEPPFQRDHLFPQADYSVADDGEWDDDWEDEDEPSSPPS